MSKESAAKAFFSWLSKKDPFIYRVIMKRHELERGEYQNLGNFFSSFDWSGLLKGAADTIKNVAPQVMKYKQQEKILDMQLKRATQGLPPANVDDYTPSIKIAPQITPATEQAITRVAVNASAGIAKNMQYGLIGLAAVAAIFFVMKIRK
ncbi:MAG: hypothetical protein COB41_05585 [Proteobacteria bacterium]|nr:MAG: hypothetical protein COB41_05585 [Pseudomonadota bacterium]